MSYTHRKLPCCSRRRAQWWGEDILAFWAAIYVLVCDCGAVYLESDVEP